MKRLIYIISCILPFVLSSCNAEDNMANMGLEIPKLGEIMCAIEETSASSRTYYEISQSPYNKIYQAKWDKEDQIAICFDGSTQAKTFKLLSGDKKTSAVFYGPLPDSFHDVVAVYPNDIFKNNAVDRIEIALPDIISYNPGRILSGVMPLVARGTSPALNFYNLMAVIKITVQGSGLLRAITISSPDGMSISGDAHIDFDDNNIPSIVMDGAGKNLIIKTGSILLSDNSTDIFIPIPAANYENGLNVDFEFEGITESRKLAGPLRFERSVLRNVKPYDFNVAFDFDNYETKTTEIWYKALKKQALVNNPVFNASVIFHAFSRGIGVISMKSEITKLDEPLFEIPESVTFIRLPKSLEEIGYAVFKNLGITEFIAPESLKILGTDAFLGCGALEKVILNDGFKSMGLEAFGDCPNLEYVYLPKSLTSIGAYSFRESTAKLDHWDGDCPLIDEDRHALYANSAYGMVNETLDAIDAIAACNLTEYRIPEQATYMQNYAFSGFLNLKKLIIHKNLNFMGVERPLTLPQLETIVSFATAPPRFNEYEDMELKMLKEILVPAESIDDYKQAAGWRVFADKIKAL